MRWRWVWLAALVCGGCGPGAAKADDVGAATADVGADRTDIGCTSICSSADQCKPGFMPKIGACVTAPATDGTPCGPATQACGPATCQAGVCTASPIACQADTACIQYRCDLAGACAPKLLPTTTPCMTPACGAGHCDGAGTCAPQPTSIGTSCTANAGLPEPCAAGVGKCAAKGNCEPAWLPYGATCTLAAANVGPCTSSIGMCGTDHKCEPKFAAAGQPCMIEGVPADPCTTSDGLCDGYNNCKPNFKPTGAACAWKSDCASLNGTCDAGHACVGAAAATKCWFETFRFHPLKNKTFYNSEHNPCFGEFYSTAQCPCAPEILLGKPCKPIIAQQCVPKATCGPQGFCSGPVVAGTPCKVDDPCAVGVCAADGSCQAKPVPGQSCDTGDLCRPNGVCSATGKCIGDPVAGLPCATTEVCAPTGTCEANGHCMGTVAVGKLCGERVGACGQPTCQADGTCKLAIAAGSPCPKNDSNPCTTSLCDCNGACVDVALPGTACTTINSQCEKGVCDPMGQCKVSAVAPGSRTDGWDCTAAKVPIVANPKVGAKCYGKCEVAGKVDADGNCATPEVAGKPCPKLWSGALCLESCTCNAKGGIDYTAKPDGTPCAAAGGCLDKSVCSAGICIKHPEADASCGPAKVCTRRYCCNGQSCADKYAGQCVNQFESIGPCDDGYGNCQESKPYGHGNGGTPDSEGEVASCWTNTSSYHAKEYACIAQCLDHLKTPCFYCAEFTPKDKCDTAEKMGSDGAACAKGLHCKSGQCITNP